jgi:hypothetical protein
MIHLQNADVMVLASALMRGIIPQCYPLDIRHFEYFQGGECLSNAHWQWPWRQHLMTNYELCPNHRKIIGKTKKSAFCVPYSVTQLYTNEKLSDFFPKCSQFLSYYIVLQFWLSTILIIYTMNGVIWSWRIKQKCQRKRFCLPIGRLFCCSVVGVALKVPLKW